MVTERAFRIIKKAVAIRLRDGDNLEDILISYPKLSEEQKDMLREEFGAN